MGRSYLGCRENISTGQIMLFCSYGEMFSRLPGKVSRCDVDFVTCKQKVFPLSGKVVFTWDRNYLGHRDLGTRENFSFHMNSVQLFILISFLYVCMVNTIYLFSFVETPLKFIIAKLSIRKLGSSSVLIIP